MQPDRDDRANEPGTESRTGSEQPQCPWGHGHLEDVDTGAGTRWTCPDCGCGVRDTAPGIYAVNAAGEMTPLQTEAGDGDEELLAEVLNEQIDDPRLITDQFSAICDAFQGGVLKSMGLTGGRGLVRLFEPEGCSVGIDHKTAQLIAWNRICDEMLIDEELIEKDHGEITPATLTDEIEADLEMIAGHNLIDRYVDELESVFEEYADKLDDTVVDDDDDMVTTLDEAANGGEP